MATVKSSNDLITAGGSGSEEVTVNIDFLKSQDCRGVVAKISVATGTLKFGTIAGTSQHGRDVTSSDGAIYLTLQGDNFYIYTADGTETFNIDL